MGFGADIQSAKEKDVSELLAQITPEDLLKFGLIPEFIGRLPIVAKLAQLDRNALVEILTEPKNALVKQYQTMLALDGVKLEFDEDAIEAIADKALERKTGARGLRAIIEDIMVNIMFDLPSVDNVEKCIVHKNCITDEKQPQLIYKPKTAAS